MSDNFSFTRIFKLESDDKLKMSPDEQILTLVTLLKGKIKNWQIIAPYKSKRIIFFEMEEGQKAEMVSGSMKELREIAKK